MEQYSTDCLKGRMEQYSSDCLKMKNGAIQQWLPEDEEWSNTAVTA